MKQDNKTKVIRRFLYLILAVFLIAAVFIGYYLYQRRNSDKKEILGTWYSADMYNLFVYEFSSDGKLLRVSKDFDNIEQNYEVVNTYEIKDELLMMKSTEWNMDYTIFFEYRFDNGNLYIKEKNEDPEIETFEEVLCRTVEEAKNNSESYHWSIDYLSTIADKDGFVIEDNVLVAYLGEAEEIQTPENITEIAFGAFSGDMGKGERLYKVTVTKNVKKIDEQAFAFTNADVIVIEEGVCELGKDCFMDSYISEIYFPSSIDTIGTGIMQTEEGLSDTVIHCVKGSKIAEYLENNMPYGMPELKYDYGDYFDN